MTQPILYSFRRCPYAMRARLALCVAGVACELREVVLRDKPPAMLAVSEKGEVPVLVLDDKTLDESRDIIFWAFEQNDPQGWLQDFQEWDDKKILAVFDNDFKHNLDRYKYASRYNTNLFKHRSVCVDILTDLEQSLGEGWLAGKQAGLLDIAVLPFVRQFRIADSQFFDGELALPNVQKWLANFLEWELFQSVMKKYPQWKEGEAGEQFPS